MAQPEVSKRVIIFDDDKDDIWRDLAKEGADIAEWEALPFSNPNDALGHFDDSIGALVTGLGKAEPFSNHHPADRLIRHATERGVGLALLSGHPLARRLIRPSTTDILIPKHLGGDVPQILSEWLIGLTVVRQA